MVRSLLKTVVIAVALIGLSPIVFAQGVVNLNTATVAELVEVKGIGPKIAEAIVAYRTSNGPFKSVDDLVNVTGIGAKSLENFRAQVTVGELPAEAAPATETSPTSPTPSAGAVPAVPATDPAVSKPKLPAQ